MKYRNLICLALFFSCLFLLLCWMLGATPWNIGEKLGQLKETMRQSESVVLYVTLVYAIMLCIPYIPGGLGLFIVMFAGVKGLSYFMAGSMMSMGLNFLIGRRYPIIMKLFRRMLEKKLNRKSWWPEGENVSIFYIVENYLKKDRMGRKINRVLNRLPLPVLTSEKTMVFVLLITPINVVVGGGGGAALVCGEDSSLSLWEYLKIAFWAHLMYGLIPLSLSHFIP